MRTIPRAMAALITPFTSDGSIDLKAHRANVALMWDRGLRGLLIAGSTGEGPYLEPGERLTLLEAAREASPRTFLLCGIQAETLRGARAMVQEAADGGADAILVVTPTTLVRHRPDLIEDYFRDVAAASPLPMMLYSVPKVTGVELTDASAIALSSGDNIIGMKDSGGDPLRAGRLVAAAPADFVLFSGSSPAVSFSIAGGAHGAITASANFAPRLVRDLVTAAHRSIRSAADLQARLSRASAAIERFGIGGVKYAAKQIGLIPGHPRRPLQDAPQDVHAEIRRALRANGLV
jgi:dihydrodipicolinate synthase/N-acetylneuraminate lyase